MSYSLLLLSLPLLLPLSLFFLFSSSSSSFTFCLLSFSFSLSLSLPSLYSPLSFPCRGGVRSKFNFHRVTPLTYRPLSLSLSLSTPDSLPSFFLLSIRETLRTRERKPPAAFLAINYAAQLFTGISSCASV